MTDDHPALTVDSHPVPALSITLPDDLSRDELATGLAQAITIRPTGPLTAQWRCGPWRRLRGTQRLRYASRRWLRDIRLRSRGWSAMTCPCRMRRGSMTICW